jgi:hypothetical protein
MQATSKLLRTTKAAVLNQPTASGVAKRAVHYHADHTDALKSSYELATKNPLLQKWWKKGATNNSFQHPTLGRITCNNAGCKDKICKSVCGTEKERAYIGHITHSNYPGSKYLSETDLQNQKKPQFGIFYNRPVKNHDTEGKNVNSDQTKVLNESDSCLMVHIYSSKNPLDDID